MSDVCVVTSLFLSHFMAHTIPSYLLRLRDINLLNIHNGKLCCIQEKDNHTIDKVHKQRTRILCHLSFVVINNNLRKL